MTEPTPTKGPTGLGPGEKTAIALAAVLVLAGGAWLLWPSAPPPPPPPAPEPAPQAEAPPAPASPVPAAEAGTKDPRTLLEGVSAHPSFRKWLAVGDLVRRWAIVTDNVAEGVTPRKQLEALDPGSPFSVERRGGRMVIAEASYARYDGFAGVVESVDAQALARAYRTLHPLLEAAYRGLGYPDGSLDRVTARAIRRVVAAPVRDGDVEVVEEDGVWLYEDPALERLPEVEKHLLRMGPRNTRIVQAKARELRDALGLPAETAKGR